MLKQQQQQQHWMIHTPNDVVNLDLFAYIHICEILKTKENNI